jgi:hypothetical protein
LGRAKELKGSLQSANGQPRDADLQHVTDDGGFQEMAKFIAVLIIAAVLPIK